MTRVLVLYYSSYGHVRALAQAEAEGARSVPGTHVDLRRVPETVPEEIRQKAGFVADDTPVAAPADLEAYDAIIFGTYLVTTEALPAGYPVTLAALRALPAGLLLLAVTRCLPPRAWLGRVFLLGSFNFALFWALLFVAA